MTLTKGQMNVILACIDSVSALATSLQRPLDETKNQPYLISEDLRALLADSANQARVIAGVMEQTLNAKRVN